MTSASSPRVFLFVVLQAGLPLLRRLGRLVTTLMRTVCLAVLRGVITAVVFTTCTIVILHFLGFPVPVPSELIDKLEGLGRLARILS
jgi:hypothetical protein